jgi:putative DNA primase/helicase
VNNKRAKPDQLDTFNDFNTALMSINSYDGIGFLVGHDICSVDLDDCFDSTGNLKHIAQSIVDEFSGCYMEYSPSGSELHIYFKVGDFTYDKTKYYINNQKIGVEVYVSGGTNHFITVTGNMYCDGDILEKKNVLQSILDEHMVRTKPITKSEITDSQSYLSDESVIEKASISVNGERFKSLWIGDTKGYASLSEADIALFRIFMKVVFGHLISERSWNLIPPIKL